MNRVHTYKTIQILFENKIINHKLKFNLNPTKIFNTIFVKIISIKFWLHIIKKIILE